MVAVVKAQTWVSVFRDGTIRFDMVDMTLTHFKPIELGLTVQDCVDLGYDKDCYGEPLKKKTKLLK